MNKNNSNNNNNNILIQPKTDTAKKKLDTPIINNNNNNNNNNKVYETDENEFFMSEDDADASLTPPLSQKIDKITKGDNYDSGNEAEQENDINTSQDALNSGHSSGPLLGDRRQNGAVTRNGKKRMHQKAATEEGEGETCQETSECIGCNTAQNKRRKKKTAAVAGPAQENLSQSLTPNEKCGNCQTMQKCMRNMMRTVEMMMNFNN